jgi:hypothetical protein
VNRSAELRPLPSGSRLRRRAVAGAAVGACAAAGLVLPGLPALAATTAVRTSVPVEPNRDTARAWAAEELAGREYRADRPNLLTRLLTWLLDHLRPPEVHGTGSKVVFLVVVLAVVAAVFYAVQRSGGFRRQAHTAGEAVFGVRILTAADHRRAAEAAERVEDWRTAVVEWFRAVTRELEERAVLVPQPCRTADEVAAAAGAWLPELADRLRRAAQLFDDVRYGERPSNTDAATTLRELDQALRRARPAADPGAQADRLVAPS